MPLLALLGVVKDDAQDLPMPRMHQSFRTPLAVAPEIRKNGRLKRSAAMIHPLIEQFETQASLLDANGQKTHWTMLSCNWLAG